MRASILAAIVLSMLAAAPMAAQVAIQSVTCPTGLTAGGPTGTYTVVLNSAAGAGLVATPDSADSAIAAVPAPFTIPTGATSFTFQVTPVSQGTADVGVTVNGGRFDCAVAVAAAVAPSTPVPLVGSTGMLVIAGLLLVAAFAMIRRL